MFRLPSPKGPGPCVRTAQRPTSRTATSTRSASRTCSEMGCAHRSSVDEAGDAREHCVVPVRGGSTGGTESGLASLTLIEPPTNIHRTACSSTKGMDMRFGLFGGARVSTDGPSTDSQGYDNFIKYVVEAERLGFESLFLVE